MPKTLRERLSESSPELFNAFTEIASEAARLLESIATQFPEFTRHDPTHAVKLERIAADILRPAILDSLTPEDLFVLLCSLWIHDAGMGVDEEIATRERHKSAYTDKLRRFERLGLGADACWQDYVREHHAEFARHLSARFVAPRATPFLAGWAGRVSESHGSRPFSDRNLWSASVAVGDGKTLHPTLLAAVLRLADILHFNEARAPEWLQEHRKVSNSVSISHWKAHQISADYHIADDVCYFDGEASDDEAYWFAQHFIDEMDAELTYCTNDIFPLLPESLRDPLRFHRVENRIHPNGFVVGSRPLLLEVDRNKFLEELLNGALYSNAPTWFRELLQNAFDACRDRVALDDASSPSVRIDVDYARDHFEVHDSGVGMTRDTVENFLFVAGASYWSSAVYRQVDTKHAGHVGRFGIGFMSVFAVATEVVVETRHVDASLGWRFTIRHPRKVIRVEEVDLPHAGTKITLSTRRGFLSALNLEELFDQTCKFPEVTIALTIGSNEVRRIDGPRLPTTATAPAKVNAISENVADARLSQHDLERPGITGTFSFTTLHLNSLEANVPAGPRYLLGAGWQSELTNRTHYGSISYPPVHALNGSTVGYFQIPQIGGLEYAVSPNVYSLEMNLARDQFITGPGTRRLLEDVIDLLDTEVSAKLEESLAGVTDPLKRSTVVALYSSEMINLWLGSAPSLSITVEAEWFADTAIGPTQWKRFRSIIMRELQLGLFTPDGDIAYRPLHELVEEQATLVAIGAYPHGISKPLCDSIREALPDAMLLIGLPAPDFGILELRHWAGAELLVPVDSHRRAAYGVRLKTSDNAHPWWPPELSHLGIGVISGPSALAAIDYRDLGAEYKAAPVGSPTIVAALNRDHAPTRHLIEALRLCTLREMREQYRDVWMGLRKALRVGNSHSYHAQASAKLSTALNNLATALWGTRSLPGTAPRYTSSDFPSYMAGSESAVPLGRFLLNQAAVDGYTELHGYERLQPFVLS